MVDELASCGLPARMTNQSALSLEISHTLGAIALQNGRNSFAVYTMVRIMYRSTYITVGCI